MTIMAVLFCLVASAQYTPTGSKTRFVNGIGLGTKSASSLGTVDSLVLFASADSSLMFKYKGTARALMYAANVGAQIHDSLYAVYQLKAGTSAGVRIVSNSGTEVALFGAGGGSGTTLYGGLSGTTIIGTAFGVNGVASAFRQYVIQTSGVGRWAVQGQGTESGSNTGTDFSIARYDDAGTNIDKPFEITRSTGIASFLYQPLLTAGAKLTNQLDLWWGGQSILAGADNNAATRTDATQKVVRYVMPHYTNASSSVALFVGIARTSVNDLYIGGGSGVNNAATDLRFYTAANTTTATGTQRARIASSGNLLIGTDTDDGVNLVQSAGSVNATQYRLSALNTAPSSASDTGTLGEIRITSTYIYICTATNTWVRAALATW